MDAKPNVEGPVTRETVRRAEGITQSERYLKKLCDRSFLSLWSYPGVFRDQGRVDGKGDGKEVCDLLVVFENHVIIFSDKYIRFDTSRGIKVGWARWFREAVMKSAQQVWGAERWIKRFPNKLFLDKECTRSFPLLLPDPSTAIVHRVVVAHDASRVCREHFQGGSGSLMLESDLIGSEMHLGRPFCIGRLDPSKGFVHVFDDTSLDIVLGYLDTVIDFVSYLTKKETLLTSNLRVLATGEEELLAQYVKKLNKEGDHDFVFPSDINGVMIAEGEWDKFLRSDERKAQSDANQVSYMWDDLVEKFAHHLMTGTQYETTEPQIALQEQSFRWLARESRTRRRLLSRSLLELMQKTPPDFRGTRVLLPSRLGEPHYLFLLLPRPSAIAEDDYRTARTTLLRELLMVVKLQYPDAQHVIGIATETLDGKDYRSEDFLHLDATEWSERLNEEARKSQRELGLLVNVQKFVGNEKEYPITDDREDSPAVSRNSPCPCGSGKRFKRCCGARKPSRPAERQRRKNG